MSYNLILLFIVWILRKTFTIKKKDKQILFTLWIDPMITLLKSCDDFRFMTSSY